MELNSCVCRMKVFSNLNSQGNGKFQIFAEGTYDFQNLENETLFIADHKIVKKSAFDWLAAVLRLKESTILWNISTF